MSDLFAWQAADPVHRRSEPIQPIQPDLRAVSPDYEEVQGLTLADLHNASEGVFNRGWAAAMAAAQDSLDIFLDALRSQHDFEVVRAREEGHAHGLQRGRDEAVGKLCGGAGHTRNTSRYGSPVDRVGRLECALVELFDELPASASKALKQRARHVMAEGMQLNEDIKAAAS